MFPAPLQIAFAPKICYNKAEKAETGGPAMDIRTLQYWHKLEHLAKYPITVSVTPNSFDRETYKYLAGRDDLAKFEESM